MENRPRAQSVLQVRSQSRGPELDKPRTTKLFSTFRGIIRFPHRKSKDDRDGHRHPYGRRGSSDAAGLKPYMSQPMLGLSASQDSRYPHVDRDCEGSSERSTSTDNSPSSRNAPSGTIPKPISKPQTLSHKPKFSVNKDLPLVVQPALIPSKRGDRIEGLPPGAKQPHAVFLGDSSTASAAAHACPSLTRKHVQQFPRSSEEVSATSNMRATDYSTQKQLPPNPSNSIQSSSSPKPDQRSLFKPQTPARSAAASSIAAQMNPDNGTDNAPTPKPSSVTPALLQRSGFGDASTPRRQGIQAPRLTLPSPSQKFMSMNDGSSARLSPSVVLRPPPLHLQLPALPPLTPTATPVKEGSHRRHLKAMPALPLQGASRGTRGHEEVDDGEDDDEDEDDETVEADVEEAPRSSIDSEASGSGSLHDSASRHLPSRPHSRGSSYYTPGEFASSSSSSSKDGDTSTARPLLPEVDTSRMDVSFLERSILTGPMDGKGKAKEEYHMLRTPVATPIRPSPSINTNVSTTDYFNSRIPAAGDRTPHPGTSYGSAMKTPKPGDAFWMPLPSPRVGGGELPMHPQMYKRASRSLMDVSAMLKERNVDMILEEEGQKEDLKGKRVSRRFREVDVRASPVVAPRTPKPDGGEAAAEQQRQKRISAAPAYDFATAPPLKRRRSMPTFTESSDPPPYPAFPPFPGAPKMLIMPREDEGKEKLPSYSNSIYLKAIMPRKLEFSAPGVQAKDRKWRRVMCVLNGTAFNVYDCPPNVAGVSTLGGWWERTVGVGDVSEDGGVVRKEGTREMERRRDKERAEERERKEQEAAEDIEQVQVIIPSPSRTSSPAPPIVGSSRDSCGQSSQQPNTQLPAAATRSALNLAVNLLKPSKAHGRSNSDVPRSPIRPRSPRPSLNLPRSSPEISSRSNSPVSGPRSSGNSAGPYNSSTLRPTSPFSSIPGTSSTLRSQIRSASSSARNSVFSDQDDIPEPNPADLIRQYTLQGAESGLGNDYLKRKNVIRVRMEGEQFLLQAKDVASVVGWIEGLQAATNIALDLDERPMPRGPLFPRRRRRRRAQATTTTTVGADAEGAAASSTGDASGRATS